MVDNFLKLYNLEINSHRENKTALQSETRYFLLCIGVYFIQLDLVK